MLNYVYDVKEEYEGGGRGERGERGERGRQGKIQKKENELNELDIGGCVGWTRIGIRGAGTHRTIVTYRTTKRREEEKKRRRE